MENSGDLRTTDEGFLSSLKTTIEDAFVPKPILVNNQHLVITDDRNANCQGCSARQDKLGNFNLSGTVCGAMEMADLAGVNSRCAIFALLQAGTRMNKDALTSFLPYFATREGIKT